MSPLAILLAMAFWAPYTPHHEYPCWPSPTFHYISVKKNPTIFGYAYVEKGGCDIWVRRDMPSQPVKVQCALIAHELGHTYMGLNHTKDKHNIMYPELVIPKKCNPNE